MFESTKINLNQLGSISFLKSTAKTHVDVVTVELPYSPKDLKDNDDAHLNEPRQQPSSRVNFNSKVYQVGRRNKQKQENHVHAAPILHRVPDISFEERRVELR